MVLGLTSLRYLGFADAMYGTLFPTEEHNGGQANQVYRYLWREIVDQQLRPGDRVIDTTVATETGVSRTSVREAIQRLLHDGLLEPLPRGVRVATLSAEEAIHLYDYRTALETYATRLATPQIPEAAVARLRAAGNQLLERLEQPGAMHDPQLAIDFIRYDVGLHQLIARHSGNPHLTRALAALQPRLGVLQVAGTQRPGQIALAIADHEAVLTALAARAAEQAAAAMERHIQDVKARMLTSFFAATTRSAQPES